MDEVKPGAAIEEQLQGLLTRATEREQKTRRRTFYLTVIPAALAVVLLMGAGLQMRTAQQAVSLANDAQEVAEDTLQSAKLELDNTYGKLAAADQAVIRAHEALTDTLKTLEVVTGNLVDSQNRFARSEVEMKALQVEVDTLQERIKVYNQQIEDLQKSLESVQGALQAATNLKRYTFPDDWLQTLEFVANAYPVAAGLLQTMGENQDAVWSDGGFSVKQGFDSPGFAAYVLGLNDRLVLEDPAERYKLMSLLPVRRGEPQVGDLVFYEGGYTMFYFIDERGVPFVMGMTSQGVLTLVPDFAPLIGYATP